MGRLRGRISKARRDLQAETVALSCPECGQEFRVGENTDVELIAYEWSRDTGAKSHRPTPQDVLTLVGHPHALENLIDRRTGEPWLEGLSNAGGHHVY